MMATANKFLRNQMRDLKKEIMKRDGYSCVFCKAVGVKFNVHHIYPWHKAPSFRFNRDNLVTLCRNCHINVAHRGNVRQEPCPETTDILKNYVRHFVCSSCGASHDRDVNAAVNILKAGREHSPLVEEIPVL
jgi:Putative transposase DNA-binding domain/HNH endonuclease